MNKPEHRIDGGTTYPPIFEVIVHGAHPAGRSRAPHMRRGIPSLRPLLSRRCRLLHTDAPTAEAVQF